MVVCVLPEGAQQPQEAEEEGKVIPLRLNCSVLLQTQTRFNCAHLFCVRPINSTGGRGIISTLENPTQRLLCPPHQLYIYFVICETNNNLSIHNNNTNNWM